MLPRGITLIALIITIIILLILAGITIGTLTGDNSLIIQTGKAKFNSEIKDIEEQLELSEIEKNDGEDYQFGTLEELIGRTDEYNDKLSLEDGKLVYDEEKVSEEEAGWLEELEIYPKKNVIPIFTAEQFQKISSGEDIAIEEMGGRTYNFAINANYSIQNNIDLGGETGNFTTISDFKGELNGNNYKISGVNTSFFTNNSGTIKNLELDIETVGAGGYGALCYQNRGVIENVKTYGKIEITQSAAGGAWTGGICYQNMSNSQIVKCINYVEIKGQTTFPGYIGGICSYNSGTIEKCGNEGKVWNASATIGGVVGLNYATIKECYNNGEVNSNSSGSWQIGGISGRNDTENSIIQDCYNFGTIKGTTGGGIAGYNYGTVKNCYNSSEILLTNSSGISSSRGKLINCWYVKNGNYDIQRPTDTGTTENCGEVTESELKQSEFLNKLNQGSNIWKQNSNKNNEYPYLAWEDEN